MKKKIAVLGSTGSIGRQTLEIVASLPEDFEIEALCAGSNLELLCEQALVFKPKFISIKDQEDVLFVRRKLETEGLQGFGIHSGEDGLVKAASLPEVQVVVLSVVGITGLLPALSAIKAGKRLALATKEALIAGGHLIKRALGENPSASLVPVDSEHSAIFQCIGKEDPANINKIILTASGGPFRNYTDEQLSKVTIAETLRHPTWKMGKKITIDSATLMNKGLEVIEAKWLFDLPADKIDVVIHPQSIIHSMVEMKDGSIIAQMSPPDMRLPIQYALTYPDRIDNPIIASLNFKEVINMTFEPPKRKLFPCLDYAYQAEKTGGTMPTVLNAANEVAVERFLNGKINFNEIPRIIRKTMYEHKIIENPDLKTILAIDSWARFCASQLINELHEFKR